MRSRLLVAASSVMFVVGCVTADLPQPTTAGQAVTTGKADPPFGTPQIGPIEGSNGSGCGAFGTVGTFEGAMIDLKNRAAAMGANYVQIFTFTEPHHGGGCYVDAFVIRGLAFRLPGVPGAVVVAPMAPPVAPPATPPMAASAAPTPAAAANAQSPAIVNTAAELRSAPSSAAPVLVRLEAGALLTVSTQVRDGWRVTSLAGGRTAYVRDADLRVAGAAPAASN